MRQLALAPRALLRGPPALAHRGQVQSVCINRVKASEQEGVQDAVRQSQVPE